MQRTQRKRSKGWRMPEGFVYVGRGTPYGNPYTIANLRKLHPNETPRQLATRACCAFQKYAQDRLRREPHWLDPLRHAKGLACWCSLDMPCHADVLAGLLLLPSPALRAAEQAVSAVIAERHRQDAKWGEQNHDAGTWALILLEEIGEWAKAELHARFGGPDANNAHTEATHMTAVALAVIECMNRKANATPSSRAPFAPTC